MPDIISRESVKKNSFANGYLGSGQVASNIPTWAIRDSLTMTKGRPYLVRLSLDAGAYTTVKVCKSGTAGTSLASCYFALYDVTSLARLSVSADISSSLGSLATNTVGSFTLNTTISTAGDYWMCLLQGNSSSAVCTLFGTTVQANDYIYNASGAQYCAIHNSGTLDATPDPLVVATSGSALNFWCQYL